MATEEVGLKYGFLLICMSARCGLSSAASTVKDRVGLAKMGGAINMVLEKEPLLEGMG